ncbi:MAG: helix-turn-helix domain-containing protein [Saprospiraceae bacterium]|nr:helix-turn-helix domain-containing protein [Saprospiraceae bacterium]
MNEQVLMAVFGSLALGHSLFLSISFWRPGKKGYLPNRLLSLQLLALAIRISKSVIVVLFPAAPDVFPAIGLIGMAAIGPLLLLYVQSLLRAGFMPKRQHGWHFALPLLLVFIIPFIGDRLMYHCYQLVVAQMAVYILISAYLLWENRHVLSSDSDGWRWLLLLHAGVAVIWLTFFAQLTLETLATYILVTLTAATVLYALSLWALSRQQIFSRHSVSKENGTPERAYEILAAELRRLFEEEEVYLNPKLTVRKLARQLDVPAYMVSKAVNQGLGKTFPELLTQYRLKEAMDRLSSPSYGHLSIEAIAFDAGFNSLSAFYAAFKKANNSTPARYREQSEAIQA